MAILSRVTHTARRTPGIARSLAFALGVLFASAAQAEVNEYNVKAAFLFNFAKFVEWPPQSFKAPTAPIVICILGPNPFGTALQETVNGKAVGGRTFSVRQVPEAEIAAGCQILFVNSGERKRFRSILPSLKGAGVLTVGEADTFIADGGVINLKVEHGSVRMEINPNAAEAADVHISAKLLSLAQVVRREP